MCTQICSQAEQSSGRIQENPVRRYDTCPSRVELGRETCATKTGTHGRAGQSERLSDLPLGRRCRRHRHSLFGKQSLNLTLSFSFFDRFVLTSYPNAHWFNRVAKRCETMNVRLVYATEQRMCQDGSME